MITNRTKVVATSFVLVACFLLVFWTCTETQKVAGFEKADIEAVMKLTGVTYNGTVQDMVKATQKAWLRPAGKERWEIEEHPHEKNHAELMRLFKKMGLVDAWNSSERFYEHILFMGATVFRMALRMETLREVLAIPVAYKDIVFLSGCRYLAENEKDFLRKRGWTFEAKTEADVFPLLFQEFGVPITKVIFINSPETVSQDGTVCRPTSESTVKDWLKTDPVPGMVLIISSQPFCHYQKVVAESLLPSSFTVRAVGEKASDDTRVAVYLDTIARTLYQWSKTQK